MTDCCWGMGRAILRLPAEWRDGERGLDCAGGIYRACGAGAEWAVHGELIRSSRLQLQYQLMRAFGRVLGLGWSQTNDNVFTGSPQPTYNQAMHWPVMHPIDIICGPYTYQCMPQPFTLRPDDLSALAELYCIGQGQAPPGKTDTLLNANQMDGRLLFPNGQGMQGVNVLGRRWAQYTATAPDEDWYTVSSVSGALFRQSNGNPVTGTDDSSMAGSMGMQRL